LLPRLAGELVALKVNVIVAVYTPCALAAKQATREIPIVVMSGDPVGTGLVTSLSRPGGNITGVSLMAAELNAKSVELIHDMFPNVRGVAALGNAGDPNPSLNKCASQVELPASKSRLPHWCWDPMRSRKHSRS